MKPGLLAILTTFSLNTWAQCSSTGAVNASSFSNNVSVGSVGWTSTSNAQLSDNIRAPANFSLGILSSSTTNYLTTTNFGLGIPANGSVCGIIVEIEKRYSLILGLLSGVTDNSVRIIKGGTISGNNHASGSSWTSFDAYTSYGGSGDKWGLTWTPTDINTIGFGVAISATVNSGLAALTLDALIDHIKITVYYNVPVPVTFSDFYAERLRDKIKLLWSTASESNSSHFIAEKRLPGSNLWTMIDSVSAAFMSASGLDYQTYDHSPFELNEYRIREVDIDGRSLFSKTIFVRYGSAAKFEVNVFPNPASHYLNVSSSGPVKLVRLMDFSGKQVASLRPSHPADKIILPVQQLRPGMYLLVIETIDDRKIQKILIN